MKLKGKLPELMPVILRKLDLTKVYDLSIEEHKDDRSGDANRYYWSLLTQFAIWSGRSKPYTHNGILARFGVEMEGPDIWLPDTEESERKAMEAATYHIAATSIVQEQRDGERTWMVRKWEHRMPSHLYNTAQFSRIIDGLIQTIEENDAPIQTMTPAELAILGGYVGKT